ncbi:MAG TPA: HPr family phosphocarrier protein [Spirochaetia bacterium]|nr:HPr family phosphocarrier protein [Spirochaetia bacterium]
MIEREVTVTNRAGIHARPAAMIVQTASRYDSRIMLGKDNEEINAKSIMGIITLGAGYDTVLNMKVEGPDEQEAADALASLFENRFQEEPA